MFNAINNHLYSPFKRHIQYNACEYQCVYTIHKHRSRII